MDSNFQLEFNNQSSNLGKKTVIFKTSATTFFEIKKKKKTDDNVENNDQVIMPGLETGNFWVIGRHDNDYYKKSWQNKVKIFWLCWIEISLKNGNLSI